MQKLTSFLSFMLLFLGFFFYFINQNSHNHPANAEKAHLNHEVVEIPEGYRIPSVKTTVTQDLSGTWLLKVETNDFKFTPEKVGENSPSYNEGHAHLYINGEKINRLYGQYYNLGTLKSGINEIKVTLHSNNHGALVYKAKAIEDTTIVEVPSETMKNGTLN
ncbi:hypothetical protein SAMN05192533_11842 [Mesobacillus persicus]|uniref:Uncharacterized protein n=1 Tax=Mesobacillus persicus TaxID=930146 RepID=A0A1H8IUY1_9BACI|nr:hypothetical protein [Mesobacillus persicus]SEN71498.1 hypothetical protein SAMN05192533_11842 [Mesobacillus persicus]